MNNNFYTSGHFETWNTCQRKYYLKYIKKFVMPALKNNALLGQEVHALINYKLRGLNIDHLEKTLSEETKLHWDSIKSNPIMKLKPIVSEWSFNVRVLDSPYWISGRVDAIFHDEENEKYIIVDWKTGKVFSKNSENNYQCKIYQYALYLAAQDLKLDLKPENIQFGYIQTLDDLDQSQTFIDFSNEKFLEYSQEFKKTLTDVNKTKTFSKCSDSISKACKFCPYNPLCFKS